jgi:DNA-binding GntR family transcriptional regulator
VRRKNLPAGIAAELRGKILRGELQPGLRLPGHRELAAMYAVSVGSDP